MRSARTFGWRGENTEEFTPGTHREAFEMALSPAFEAVLGHSSTSKVQLEPR
jgi:hypothetical protein